MTAPLDNALGGVDHPAWGDAHGVPGPGDPDVDDDVRMVVQVLADAGQIVQGRNPVVDQMAMRADTRQHQDLRRHQGAGTQQYFACDPQLLELAQVLELHTHRPLLIEQDAGE